MRKADGKFICLIILLIIGCNPDDQQVGCINEDILCQESLENLDNSTFRGNLHYCNAQPLHFTTQAIASVFMGDTGATILLKSDPAGFIDTFFHVSYHCSTYPECLFGNVDFVNDNQETIIEYQGGNTPFLRVKNTAYLDCSYTFEGRLMQ